MPYNNFLDEYENLDAYNGDTIHDMNVDFDRYENTGEPDFFEVKDLEEFVDNLND